MKTYTEALKKDFKNGMKETREGFVSDKERNTGIPDNVSYVNKVMECNKEDSSEFGMSKPHFWEIYKDLLLFERMASSEIISTPALIQTNLLLVMLAIVVLGVRLHLQICHWIQMMRRF